MKQFIIVLLFLNLNNLILAQNSLVIEPYLGFQNIFCRYQKKTDKKEFIKINTVHSISMSFGVLVKFKRNNFEYFTGINREEIGGSISIKHSNINNNSTLTSSEKTSVSMFQIPFGFNYIFKNFDLKRNNIQIGYGADLRFIFLPNIWDDGEMDVSLADSGDTITISSHGRYKSFGLSFANTLSFDIYKKLNGKKRISFMLYYELGLRNIYFSDVEYKINSNKDRITLASRGTNIGLKLGFPINLKRKR